MPIPLAPWLAYKLLYAVGILIPFVFAVSFQQLPFKIGKIRNALYGGVTISFLVGAVFAVFPLLGWCAYPFKGFHGERWHVYGDHVLNYPHSFQYALGVLEPIIGVLLVVMTFLFLMGRSTDTEDPDYDPLYDSAMPTERWYWEYGE